MDYKTFSILNHINFIHRNSSQTHQWLSQNCLFLLQLQHFSNLLTTQQHIQWIFISTHCITMCIQIYQPQKINNINSTCIEWRSIEKVLAGCLPLQIHSIMWMRSVIRKPYVCMEIVLFVHTTEKVSYFSHLFLLHSFSISFLVPYFSFEFIISVLILLFLFLRHWTNKTKKK